MLWRSLRGRLTKIGSLDNLFTVQSNPLSLFSIGTFKTAPYALLVAAIAWTIPIVAILTPGTLGVDDLTTQSALSCQVPTFPGNTDLQDHSVYSHRFHQGVPGTHFDPYLSSSEELKDLASQTLVGGEILPIASPCASNCSFQIEFQAPALKCVDEPLPSLYMYMPLYSCIEDDLNSVNITVTYLNAYSFNITLAHEDGTHDDYSKGFRTISCRTFEAAYKLNTIFINGEPFYQTSIVYGKELRQLNSTGEFISKENVQYSNYLTLTIVTLGYLIGTVPQYDDPSATSTQIQKTLLAASITTSNDIVRAFEVLKDLRTGIPELLHNITLSTLSWNEVQINTICTKFSTFPAYTYQAFWLICPYVVAAILTLFCAYIGSFAVYSSGIRTGDLFSQILLATRNPVLIQMTEGHSLTSHGFKWLKGQRIMLGEFRKSGRENGELVAMRGNRATFGV